MTYDIIAGLLICLAFISGFQKSIIRTLSILLSVLAGLIITIMTSPYILAFLEASFSEFRSSTTVGLLIFFVVVFSVFLHSILRFLWLDVSGKGRLGQHILGGILLSVVMVVTISAFSSFLEQASLLTKSTKDSSKVYAALTPLRDQSRILWKDIQENARAIKSDNYSSSIN